MKNDGDGLRLLVGLQALADLDAVHLGHHDVEQDQVRLVGLDQVQRLPTE